MLCAAMYIVVLLLLSFVSVSVSGAPRIIQREYFQGIILVFLIRDGIPYRVSR